ncbi:MAG TPA: hypothetical protein VD948_08725 [Rhodothermales bacterium]|nr:hypothetical protein [Rhodothermales bacterium]
MDPTLPIGAAMVLAAYLVGRRLWWAWLLSAVGSLAWVGWGVYTGQLGLIVECVPSFFVHLHNARKWKRERDTRTSALREFMEYGTGPYAQDDDYDPSDRTVPVCPICGEPEFPYGHDRFDHRQEVLRPSAELAARRG